VAVERVDRGLMWSRCLLAVVGDATSASSFALVAPHPLCRAAPWPGGLGCHTSIEVFLDAGERVAEGSAEIELGHVWVVGHEGLVTSPMLTLKTLT